jgi:hypothetical protein
MLLLVYYALPHWFAIGRKNDVYRCRDLLAAGRLLILWMILLVIACDWNGSDRYGSLQYSALDLDC